MDKLIEFTGKILERVELGRAHNDVHPAWRDDTNEGFLVCYELLLLFQDKSSFIIKPIEVDLPERYPSLGLSISDAKATNMELSLNDLNLPSKVVNVEQSDFLGENVINQYKLMLHNNQTLIVRHVFPPMSMGVKVEQ